MQIGGEDLVPHRRILVPHRALGRREHTGVIDEHIDRAEATVCLSDDALASLTVATLSPGIRQPGFVGERAQLD